MTADEFQQRVLEELTLVQEQQSALDRKLEKTLLMQEMTAEAIKELFLFNGQIGRLEAIATKFNGRVRDTEPAPAPDEAGGVQ